MSDETALADLLEFVLAGRPERLSDLAASQMTPEERTTLAAVTETAATLAMTLEPVKPSPAVRDRILASLQERLAHKPHRALLVCDMILDHLEPGRPLEVPRARRIVPALARRIAQARASRIPVVYVLDRHQLEDPELDEWGAHAVEGTKGAEVWPALAPEPGDHIVTKPSYSGFFGSRLETVLEELSVDTLVVTGCATEVQLMLTATDALQRGFAVEVPPDVQAGASEAGETVAMAVLSSLVPYAPARKSLLGRMAKGS